MAATLRGICRLATILMVLLMTTMLVVINSLVITRYFFSYSPSWTEEVTRYAMIWMVMLGAGILTLFDDHISLTMAVEKLSPRARRWQRLLVHVFVLIIALLTAWKGYEFAFGLKEVIAPALQISMLHPALSVPIGASIIAICAAIRIAIESATILGTTPMPIPEQFEFMDNTFKPSGDQDAAPAINGASQRTP